MGRKRKTRRTGIRKRIEKRQVGEKSPEKLNRICELLEPRVLLSVSEPVTVFDSAQSDRSHISDSLLESIHRSSQLDQYSNAQLASVGQWVVLLEPDSDPGLLGEAVNAKSITPAPYIPWAYVVDVEPRSQRANATAKDRVNDTQKSIEAELGVIDLYPLVPQERARRMDAPADPFFANQWHLQNPISVLPDVNVIDAWNLNGDTYEGVTGDDDGRVIVVGVVDDGVQHTHPDLVKNRWSNAGEADGDANGDGAPGRARVDDDNDGLVDEDLNGCGVIFAADGTVAAHRDANGAFCEYEDNADADDDENGYVDDLLGFDFRFGDNEPAPTSSDGGLVNCDDDEDACDAHGTSVAGIIAAFGHDPPGPDPAIGVSGVAPRARFAPIRLIGGAQTDLMEAQALTYDNQDIHIYNNSWGPPDDRDFHAFGPLVGEAFEDGVENGRNGLGSIFVWAAGNGGNEGVVPDRSDYDQYASSRYTIAVGGTGKVGLKTPSSEAGSSVLVAAGGAEIMTTDLQGDDGYSDGTDEHICGAGMALDPDYTACFNGTSSAAPQVAGVVALMLEANPNLNWRDVQHILVESATKNHTTDTNWTVNQAGHDINDKYGFGFVNAAGAVDLARTWISVDDEVTPTPVTTAVGSPLSDGGAAVKSTVTYPALVSIETVEVTVDITHPHVHDLDIFLTHTSADGSQTTVSNFSDPRAPDDAQSNLQWTFTSVRHWGETSDGTWTLSVRDGRSVENTANGTLNDWTLKINGTEKVLTADEASAQFQGLNITPTGATIIVPGFEPLDDGGDTLLPMAQVIRNQAESVAGESWLFDYDHARGGFHSSQSVLPIPAQEDSSGEVVLLFDWALASRQVSEGWAEASGDALFSMMVDLGLADPEAGIGVPLHFVGVGMGATVASEAVERLGYYDIDVDHLTYLDPHDFDQGLVYDTAQDFDSLTQLPGYGAAVWDNVTFADVYYQTRGVNGPDLSNSLVPEGRPIPGAYNFWLNDSNHLPSADYDELNIFGDHEYVANGFYLTTVNDVAPPNNEAASLVKNAPAPATPIPATGLGYAFSRLQSGEASRPDPQFYEFRNRGNWAIGQFYEEFDIVTHAGQTWQARVSHTSRNAVRASGGFAPEPFRNEPGQETVGAPPEIEANYFWEPISAADIPAMQDHEHTPSSLYNTVETTIERPNMAGLFGFGLDENDIIESKLQPQWNPLEIFNGNFEQQGDEIALESRKVPGWSYHTESRADQTRPTNPDLGLGYATLDDETPAITHNSVFVSEEAEFVTVAVQVTGISGDDQLVIKLGNEVLTAVGSNPLATITADFEDVRFAIPENLRNQAHTLSVELMNVGSFEASVRVKDVRFEGLAYSVKEGDIATVDLTEIFGAGPYRINSFADTETYRLFFPAGEDENSFNGVLFISPKIESTGANHKAADPRATISVTDTGMSKDFIMRVNVVDGYSTSGDNSVDLTDTVGGSGATNDLLDVLRVQQRLRYLNFRGERIGSGDSAVVPDVEVTGVINLATRQAIQLFKASVAPEGNGDPDDETDVISPNQTEERWLNSGDAPIWTEIRTPLVNRINIGNEVWDTHWTIQKIENAYADRPELKRTTGQEEFGINSLTEYPDLGTPATSGDNVNHPDHSHKSGHNIDVELDREALTAGDPTETQNAIDDILAFVGADGVQIRSLYVGQNSTQYADVRTAVQAAIDDPTNSLPTVPDLDFKTGHFHHFSVDFLPKQFDERLTAATRSNIIDAFETVRDNMARAVMLMDEATHTLPMVDRSIADSLDLEQAVQIALLDRIAEIFQLSDPRVGDLLTGLKDYRVVDDGLVGELQNVVVDVDKTTGEDRLQLEFIFRATQLNLINAGGDLPQNRNDTPDLLDETGAAQNLAIDLSFPMKMFIPLSESVTPDEVAVEVGDIEIDASSVSIRNYDARIGLAPVKVVHDPVILEGELTTQVQSSDGDRPTTLEELADPFLVAADPTITANTIRGVLPIEHEQCAMLSGDPRVIITSDNIFVDEEANVSTTADVNDLAIFASLTAADIVGGLDAAINAIRTVTQSGLAQQITPDTPLIGPAATRIIDALNDATDFVDRFISNDNVDLNFATLNELIGVTGLALGIRRDSVDSLCAGNAFTLTLDYDRSFTEPVTLDPTSESLGPINVSAGIQAELVASLSFDLDIGFLFGFTDKSESEFLNLALSELNGGAGMRTVTGPDIELFIPEMTEGRTVNMAEATAADVMGDLDGETTIPEQLRTALAGMGLTISNTATIRINERREEWHVEDKANNRTWQIDAIRSNPEETAAFLNDPTGFRVSGPGYLVDLTPATTVQDMFNRINTGTGGRVTHELNTDDAGNVTGFALVAQSAPDTSRADEGMFMIRPVVGTNSEGQQVTSQAGEDIAVLGIDVTGEGKLFGAIDTLELPDRIFFGPGSGLTLSGEFNATDIDAGVSLFGIGAEIVNGELDFDVTTSLTLEDSGSGAEDGRLTLRELAEGPFVDVVNFSIPRVVGTGRLPLIAQPDELNQEFGIDPDHPTTDADDGPEILINFETPEIDVASAARDDGLVVAAAQPLIEIGGPVKLSIVGNDEFERIFEDLRNFVPDDFCEALDRIILLLRAGDFGFMNENIPLVNQSLSELLAPEGPLREVIGVLCPNEDDIRNALTDLLPDLDNPEDPDRGAIPALLDELNDDQREELYALRDSLGSAINAPTPTPEPEAGAGDEDEITPEAATDIVARVMSVIQRFRSFLEGLPNTPAKNQLIDVIDRLEDAVPSVEALERTVEDALGLETPAERMQFELEFDFGEDDKSIVAIFDDYEIFGFDTDDPETDPLSLDFEFGADDDFVQLSTMGGLEGGVGATFDLAIGFNLAPDLPFSERIFFDVTAPRETKITVNAGLDAMLSGDLTLGGMNAAELDMAEARFASVDSRTATSMGNGSNLSFNWNSNIPAAHLPLAFVKVNDAPFNDLDAYTLTAGGVTFTAGNAPANGATVSVDFLTNDDAELVIELQDPDPMGDGRVTLGELFDGPGAESEDVDEGFIDVEISAGLGANLPFNAAAGTIQGEVRAFVDFNDISNPAFQFDAGLSDWLDNLISGDSCNLPALVNGINMFGTVLEDALASEFMSQLPLIGDDLNTAGAFVGEFNDFTAGLAAVVNTEGLQNLIFNTLGPGSANNILRLPNGDPLTMASQIDAEIPEEGSECARVNLRIGNTINLAEVDFDMGIDTVVFDLQSQGGLEVGFDYDIQIGFGLDITKGPYFILNENANDPEIELELFAELTNDAGIMVDLFFLAAEATENPAQRMVDGELTDVNTGLSGSLNLDIDGGSDNELTFNELTELPIGDVFGLELDVMAIVDLELAAGVADLNKFPSFGVDFYFEWGLQASTSEEEPFTVGDPIVELNNFGINLGQYVSNVVSPIVQKIDEYLEPIDPLIDFLSLELPLISDVAEFLGQDPITVVDVIALFGEGGETAAEFIDTVIKIREIVDALAGMPGDDIRFEFGSFDTLVSPRENRDLSDFLDPANLSDPGTNDPEEAQQMLEDSADADTSFLGEIFGFLNDIGISFPIIEEPTSAFGVLMGQPVDLVKYDFLGDKRLEAGFDWSVTFGPIIPPVPLFVEIFAEFGVFADFVIGLDTFGLQSGNFIDGLFFEDEEPVIGVTAGFGAAAELNAGLVWGGVRGGVEAEIGAGWNDVNDDGKFRIPEILQRANQGLHCIFDLRGKMDAFVEAYAGLGINIFGAKVTIFEKTIEILRATIFDFNVGCPPLEPPVLAHIDGSDDLIVHIGPNAHLRQNGATDGEDTITIEQPERGENAGKTVIIGFGQEQPFEGFDKIVIHAGAEIDNITIDASITSPVEVHGGEGDDIILVNATGSHVLNGDAGNDRLVVGGGALASTLSGGEGDDFLQGGDGNDSLVGGGGNDLMQGNGGNDTIRGGDGDDEADGGLGSDDIFGDAGNDSLTGGPAGDGNMDGGNTVEGGPGDDFVQGGNANDVLRGGDGDDTLAGNEGDDDVRGDGGKDLVFGGDGNDSLRGGEGNDQVEGGAGNDRYIFDPTTISDRDELSETSGSDTIDFTPITEDVTVNMIKGTARHGKRRIEMNPPLQFEHAVGGSGNDTFYDSSVDNSFQGQGGDDTYVFGNFPGTQTDAVIETGGINTDSDTVSFAAINFPITADLSAGNVDIPQAAVIATHTGRTVMVTTTAPGIGNGNRASIENIIGGKQADTIRGNNGNNELSGRGGVDTIRGESGNDTIRGGNANDELFGDAGNDEIFGDNGADTIMGGTGGDTAHGGAGDDDIFGNGGADELNGDGGNDFLHGQNGNDTINGGAGFDTGWGGNNNDVLNGGQGEDRLFGESGDDTAMGGPGRDFILGHTGNDNLKGGSGDDFISGGSDTGNRDDAAVFALELTQTMLDSFGDELDGQSGHDFVVGGQPWDNAAPNTEDGLVAYVAQFFADMFVDGGTNPRPLFFAGDGFDVSPANFVNLYFKVEFADPSADGDDLLHGGLANDLLVGGDGLDHLYGDWGNDALFAFRISDVGPEDGGTTSTMATDGDRLEGGPNDDGPICGTHQANAMVGGTSDQNLQFILDSRPANETPPNGGYQFISCTDEPPPLPEFERVEIQGQKFRDINANGVRDAGEIGLSGWTIELRDVEGDLLAQTVTQSIDINNDGAIDPETESGLYYFRDVEMHDDGNVEDFVEGTYFVSEVIENGFGQSFPPIGLTTPVPSGVATAVAGSEPNTTGWEVLLRSGPDPGDGEVATGLDFGNATLPRISGFAWLDIDGDNERDENEPPFAGIDVGLFTNIFAMPEQTVPTDEQGFYEFDNLQPGQYFIAALTDGDFRRSPPLYLQTVDYEEVHSGLDFAIVELGSISGTAWHDLNANGLRDIGEPDWPDAFDLTVNGVTTLENGSYVSDDHRPGIYTLSADPGAGTFQSFPTEATLEQHQFLIESGTVIESPSADFGFYRNGRISGRVVNDVNGDGQFFELGGLTGVTVFLDDDENGELDPGEQSTLTVGPFGSFSFNGLEPGEYIVSYLVPAGREDTTPDGTSISVDVVSDLTTNVIFGASRALQIDGTVFFDRNLNGIRERGEEGLANWLIFLDENNDTRATRDQFNDEAERTARTLFDDPTTMPDETGEYLLDDLTPGATRIVLEVQPGWIPTTAVNPVVNLNNADRTFEFGVHPFECSDTLDFEEFVNLIELAGFPLADINFDRIVDVRDFLRLSSNFNTLTNYEGGDINCSGNVDVRDFLILSREFGTRTVPTVEITGQKFLDANNNGLKEGGETGLDGFTVQLHAADGTFLAETETFSLDLDQNGSIDPNLESGLYFFRDASMPGGNVPGFAGGQKYFVSVAPREGFQSSVVIGSTLDVPAGSAEGTTQLIDGSSRTGFLVPMANNVNEITDNINLGSVEQARGGREVPDRFDLRSRNDTIASATNLGTGDQRQEKLNITTCGPGTEFCSENDFFRWTATAPGTLTVDALFAVRRPGLDNLDLELLNSRGVRLDISQTDSANERVTTRVTAGQTVFIRVFGVAGWTNDYTLVIDGPDIPPDRFEPNNSIEAAAKLDPGDGNYPNLTIHAPNNEDWYAWESPVTEIAVITTASQIANGNVDLELYDANGNRIAFSNSANSGFERIQTRVIAGDQYFVRVFGFRGAVSPDYDLRMDVPDIGEDRFEPNSSFDRPADLGSDSQKQENLTIHNCPPGTEFCSDPDFFSWTAPSDGEVKIGILFSHELGNLDLRVFDASNLRTPIAESLSRTDDETVTVPVRAGRRYIIQVFGPTGFTHPDYDLCIDFAGDLGSISGSKFEDLDIDGIRDFGIVVGGGSTPTEPLLPGWTIYIDANNNSQLDPGERSTVTDLRGRYQFNDLPAGTYIIREVVQPGWTQTAPKTSFDVTTYPVSQQTFTQLTDIVSADFNNDGFGDVAVAVFEGESRVLISEGDEEGQLNDPFELPQLSGGQIKVTTIDFNGDGVQDLAYADEKGLGIVMHNGGGYDLVSTTDTIDIPADLIAADFDDDGIEDVAILFRRRGLGIYTGRGDGLFNAPVIFEVPGLPQSLDQADFDNDGLPDLAVMTLNGNFGSVVALQNSATNPGTLQVRSSTAAGPAIVHATDWNQDGHRDVGVSNAALAGSVSTFPEGFVVGDTISPTFQSIDSGDFTHNDYPDAVGVASLGNFNRVRILPNEDGTGFGTPIDLPVTSPLIGEFQMNLIEVGDINGDGNPDIISTSNVTPAVHVFLGSHPYSHTVTIDDGEDLTGKDFGNARGGSITGFKFEDADCQGPHNPDTDSRLEGFTIYVDLNDNGELDPGEPFDVTDENGIYTITNVPIGTWSVREVQQEGFQQSFPDDGRHVVTIGQSNGRVRNINFGNYQQERLDDGSDRIFGYSGVDVIFGDNAIADPCIENAGDDDELHGMQDNDIIAGQQRNDTYFYDLDSGDDAIVEFEGTGTNARTDEGIADRLDFSALTADQSVIANLSPVSPFAGPLRIAEFGIRTGDSPVTITVSGSVAVPPGGKEFIEQLVGGAGNDVLVANGADNLLDGRGGADLQQGGAGDDTYSFGLDSGSGDQLIETIGSDTLDFSRFTDRAVTVNLITGTAVHSGGSITIDDPHLFENVIGANFVPTGDTIIGNDDANILNGTLGPDSILGGGGDDTLIGGLEDDLYLFGDGWGSDTLVELPGGGDLDIINFSAVTANLTFTIGADIDVTDGVNTMFHEGLEIEELLAGSGTNTLVGGPGNNTWIIDGVDTGTLNGVRFTNIANLQGGPDADEYIFLPTGQLTGGLSSGAGPDVIDLTQGGTVVGTIDGEGGTNTILAPFDNVNAFTLTGDFAGQLTVTTPGGAPVANYTFANVPNLTGGQFDDTYRLGTFRMRIADAGDGDDRLFTNPSAVASTRFIGVGTGVVVDAANTFAAGFLSIENITGGTADDIYAIDGGSIRGVIDGGGGNNQLVGDNTPYLFEVLEPNGGRATSVGSFQNIQRLRGGESDDTFMLVDPTIGDIDGNLGNDRIIGPNVNNTVNITGMDGGDIGGVNFVSVENIVGNEMDDTFTFVGFNILTGSVDGVGGDDTISIPNRPVIAQINGTNSGQFFFGTETTQFANVETLNTSSSNDTVQVLFGSLGTLNAGGGSDRLIGGNQETTYSLTGNDAGTSTQIATFTGVENLFGGLVNDIFEMNGHTVSGVAFGGPGDDIFDFSGGGVIGSPTGIRGQAGIDTLIAPDGIANTFAISGIGEGTLNGTLPYRDMENLVGGSLDDTFTLPSTLVPVVELIDGAGGSNTLELGSNDNLYQITGVDAGTGTAVSQFMNVGTLIGNTGEDIFEIAGGTLGGSIDGGAGTSDRLQGTTSALVFTITGENEGSVSAVAGGFTQIENLGGSSGDDTFEFLAGGTTTGSDQIVSGEGNDVFLVTITAGAIYNLTGGPDEDSVTIDAGAGTVTEFQILGVTFVNVMPAGSSVRLREIEEINIICDTCPAPPAPLPAAALALLEDEDAELLLTLDDDDEDFAEGVDAFFGDFE